MAVLTHVNGEQLSQTRMKAQLNFEDVIATHVEILVSELVVVRSGMGLSQFRDACRENFDKIALDLVLTLETIDDGDMLWTVRDKLNANFATIAAS